MLVKTLLIFLIGFLGYSEWLLGTSYFQRPIVLGPLVGLVMGGRCHGCHHGCDDGARHGGSHFRRCV